MSARTPSRPPGGPPARSSGTADFRSRQRTLLALVAVLLCGACRQVEPLPAEALRDIDSLEQFTAAFNAAADRHRLLVLVAPT